MGHAANGLSFPVVSDSAVSISFSPVGIAVLRKTA